MEEKASLSPVLPAPAGRNKDSVGPIPGGADPDDAPQTRVLRDATPGIRRRWLLLLVLVAILVVVVPPVFRLGLRTVGVNYYGLPVPPVSPYRQDTRLRVGNMEGVRLAIPGNLLEFAVEYMDKSAWEPKGEGYYERKTFADPIRNFALYVRWPDLVGRTPETEESYRNGKKPGPSDWIGISVDNDYARVARRPPDQRPGMEWLLRWNMKRLSNEWLSQHPVITFEQGSDGKTVRRHIVPDIRYEVRERDPLTGLQAAIPVGADAAMRFVDNTSLYWQGDRDKKLDFVIECPHGTPIRNPSAVFRCQHRYILPELGAYVVLSYTSNWLPHWRELQDKTRDFVLSLRAEGAETRRPADH